MNIMTVLIIIVTLILVGMFWRQIIKGGLISLIILLFLSLIAYFFLSNSAYAKQDLNNFSLSHMLRCAHNYESRYVVLLLEKYNGDTYLHFRVQERVSGKLQYIKEHADPNCLSNTHLEDNIHDVITYCNQPLTPTPDLKIENIIAVWFYDRNKDTLTDFFGEKEYKCDPWPLKEN
mgnify:FL=1